MQSDWSVAAWIATLPRPSLPLSACGSLDLLWLYVLWWSIYGVAAIWAFTYIMRTWGLSENQCAPIVQELVPQVAIFVLLPTDQPYYFTLCYLTEDTVCRWPQCIFCVKKPPLWRSPYKSDHLYSLLLSHFLSNLWVILPESECGSCGASACCNLNYFAGHNNISVTLKLEQNSHSVFL